MTFNAVDFSFFLLRFNWIYNTFYCYIYLLLLLHRVIMIRDMMKIYTFKLRFPISFVKLLLQFLFSASFPFINRRAKPLLLLPLILLCFFSSFICYLIFVVFFSYLPGFPFLSQFYSIIHTVTCIQSVCIKWYNRERERQINNRKYVFIARATFWICIKRKWIACLTQQTSECSKT